MDEYKKSYEKILAIVIISVIIGVFILSLVVILNALNQGNTNSGQTIYVTNRSEVLETQAGTYSLSANSLENPECQIIFVKDTLGNTIDPSNYTINNCQITYSP
jgi:hypothetical protein